MDKKRKIAKKDYADIDFWERFYKCTCGDHVMEIMTTDDLFYEFKFYTNHTLPLKIKLKFCWQLLFSRFLEWNGISITRPDIIRMQEEIKKRLDETTAEEVE
jgi:hypothetical protein